VQKPGWDRRYAVAGLPLVLMAIMGCYSFTGASVPAHLRTIAIPVVDDQSNFGEPGLREQFTRELTTKFITDNSLQVADRAGADCMLEGTILTVADAPQVIQPGEQVSKRRITVTVRFAFQDLRLKRKAWEKSFSNWGDYDSGGGLSRRQDGLRDALSKLTDDVLLETVSGW
jgi:hypothetical protein